MGISTPRYNIVMAKRCPSLKKNENMERTEEISEGGKGKAPTYVRILPSLEAPTIGFNFLGFSRLPKLGNEQIRCSRSIGLSKSPNG